MAFNVRYKHLLNNRLDRGSPTENADKEEYYRGMYESSSSDEDSDSVDDDYDQEWELQNDFDGGASNHYGPIPPPQFDYGPGMGNGQPWQPQYRTQQGSMVPPKSHKRHQQGPPGSGYGYGDQRMQQNWNGGYDDGYGDGEPQAAFCR